MKRTVYLHGSLGDRFGNSFIFDVDMPWEMVSALKHQIKGFANAIREGKYILIRGGKDTGQSIGVEDLALAFGGTREFHIIPALEGSGGRVGAIIKVVVGVALIATGIGAAAGAATLASAAFSIGAVAVTWGGIAATGLAITLAGISSLLSPRADMSPQNYEALEPADQRASFLFTGPKNQSQQGAAVPLVYGLVRAGSIVVSTGLTTEAV